MPAYAFVQVVSHSETVNTVQKKPKISPTTIPTTLPHTGTNAWVEQVRKCIVHRESRGRYHVASKVWVKGDRATGAYQFMGHTWRKVTGLPGEAKDYAPAVQDAAFYKLFAGGRHKGHWYLKGGPQCW